jgi:hypothetical protein
MSSHDVDDASTTTKTTTTNHSSANSSTIPRFVKAERPFTMLPLRPRLCFLSRNENGKGHNQRREHKHHERIFDTIGGVFATSSSEEKDSSVKSIITLDTVRSSNDTISGASGWSSSGSDNHHVGAPKLARSSGTRTLLSGDINDDEVKVTASGGDDESPSSSGLGDDWELGDEELLGRIMLKSRKLPKHSGNYASNHVMINSERVRGGIAPLTRMPHMDELARKRASAMAERSRLDHCTDPTDLREQMGTKLAGRRIGENVALGSDLRSMHRSMMACTADRNNILDRRYLYMGIGTAKGGDGTLYLCQIFQN